MNNQNPNIEPTQPSPPPEGNETQESTQQQTSNQPIYRPPNNNNNSWQSGEHKYDVERNEYLIEQELGRGGFGITYLATEIATNQKVVIKILKDELRHRGDFDIIRDNFINEALSLRGCQSRFIVSVDKVTKIDNQQAIIMEYIDGQSLVNKVARQGGKLPIDIALKYIQQIGKALETVHAQKLLHRDIKPENIIIRNHSDEAVLIDFGLAFKFDPDNTQYNRQWLTPGYAPIEQYESQVRWGFYTDVYSLAATLYSSLTGYIPIAAPDRIRERLPTPQTLNPEISDRVNYAIMKGLTLEPFSRPQTVEAWLNLFKDSSPAKSQNKKLALLFGLGLIAIIAIFLFVVKKHLCNQFTFALLVNLKICSVSEVEWQNYTSTQYEFKLKYPASWTREEVPKDALRPWQLKFYAPGNSDKQIIVIFVEELNDLYSLEEYWQNIVKPRIENQWKSVKFADSSPQSFKLKVNSDQKEHSALKLDYTYDQDGKLIKVTEVITVYNYRGYNIIFQRNNDQYNQYRQVALQLIDSFELTIP